MKLSLYETIVVEGIAGGVGTAIFYMMVTHPRNIFFFKQMGIRLGIAFFLTWSIRRIIVNFYKEILIPKGIRIPKI